MTGSTCANCLGPIEGEGVEGILGLGDRYCELCAEEQKKDLSAQIEKNISGREAKEKREEISEQNFAISLMKGQGFAAAAKKLQQMRPFFIDNKRLLWIWDHDRSRWELSPDLWSRPISLAMTMKKAMSLFGDTLVIHEMNILKAIEHEGHSWKPEYLSPDWIQFGNTVTNIMTGEQRESSPAWFVPNAIPWNAQTGATPTIDRLLVDWVGNKHAITLKQFLAYATYRRYPIHVILCAYGSGRNGKSSYLKLLSKFLGENNTASTELDRLTSNRFETFALYNKLIAVVGETDGEILKKTSLLKELSAGGYIPYEKKGGVRFDATNYAKLFVATNNLPVTSDASDGFMSRWVVVDFPNQYPLGKDVIDTIPDDEYRALAAQVPRILQDLLSQQEFLGQGSIDERRKAYTARSEPVRRFINDFCDDDDPDAEISLPEFTAAFNNWMGEQRLRIPSSKAIGLQLKAIGHESSKTSVPKKAGVGYKSIRVIYGLKFKSHSGYAGYSTISTPLSHIGKGVENIGISGISGITHTTKDNIIPEEATFYPEQGIRWSYFLETAQRNKSYSFDEMYSFVGGDPDSFRTLLEKSLEQGDIMRRRGSTDCFEVL